MNILYDLFQLQSPFLPSHGRPHGHSLSAKDFEPTAEQPHSGNTARTSRPTPEAAALIGKGGGAVQVLQPQRPLHQNEGDASVSRSFLRIPQSQKILLR